MHQAHREAAARIVDVMEELARLLEVELPMSRDETLRWVTESKSNERQVRTLVEGFEAIAWDLLANPQLRADLRAEKPACIRRPLEAWREHLAQVKVAKRRAAARIN